MTNSVLPRSEVGLLIVAIIRFRILTVPCGLPRDVCDFAAAIAAEDPSALARIEYTGMDIDPEVIEAARAFLASSVIRDPGLQRGNALNADDFPGSQPQFISSTGLGEFLDDAALATFYQNVFAALPPDGTFFTSAAARGKGSDILLRAFELHVNYRSSGEISRILAMQPWSSIAITRDSVGLQTFVRATK